MNSIRLIQNFIIQPKSQRRVLFQEINQQETLVL